MPFYKATRSTKTIPTSTGDIGRPYKVIDTIFAIDSNKEGLLSGADPNTAFNGVKNQLRKKCAAMGGDAVIFCQFQYRVAVDSGLTGSKQVVEIFAYGTAVQFLN